MNVLEEASGRCLLFETLVAVPATLQLPTPFIFDFLF